MSARRQIPENIQNQIRQRANCLCEYCHASEQWQYVKYHCLIPDKIAGTKILFGLRMDYQ
jgi:hypothetical protein